MRVSLPISFIGGLLVGFPVWAEGAWSRINDALFSALIDPRDIDVVHEMPPVPPETVLQSMQAAGAVSRGTVAFPSADYWTGKSIALPTYSIALDGTLFVLINGFENNVVGILQVFGGADHEIPGLRGFYSDCEDESQAACDTLDYSRLSSWSLGLASCLCDGQAADLGGGLLGLKCYFGRGGTYLDYAMAFGPIKPETIDTFVNDLNLETRRQICLGSPIAHQFPKFLVHYVSDEKLSPPFEGIDYGMRPISLAARNDGVVGYVIDPMAILVYLKWR